MGRSLRALKRGALVLGALSALAPAAAPAQAQTGDVVFRTSVAGGIPCQARQGVRFCGGSVANRVPTFDDVPLDVNVSLPASGSGPFPLVIQLHGWGGNKGSADSQRRWAQKGYAVLNYSARGFGDSCGLITSRNDPRCARGWVRLADSRYEARDSQYLAGLLADEGWVDPQRIGVTGGSYGGGQSTELAILRDRIRNPDGTYAPWTSPAGKPMRIAAAAPTIPWTDLVYSLVPNGRTLDYTLTGQGLPGSPAVGEDLSPVGVPKESWVAALYAAGQALGFYAPPGVDRDADLNTWYARVRSGEPYVDPVTQDIIDEIARHHSPYYLDQSQAPAPLFISNGTTDDLFPVDEAVRLVNRVREQFPTTPVAQFHYDYGHQRGQNKGADNALRNDRIEAWFDHYLKGVGPAPANGVEMLTQSCGGAPSEGPFAAATWGQLHPGEVRFSQAAPEVATSEVDSVDKRVTDPIAAGNNPCNTDQARDQEPGTATYRLPAVTGNGYTLLGSPTVIADLSVAGARAEDTQLDARLWDVGPDGRQTLVARAVYRPQASGRQVFQLHPNGYRFAAGRVPKLELLGQDTPYARKSTGPGNAFAITVSNLDFRLPTREAGECGPDAQVLKPAPPVLPPGSQPASEAAVPSDPCPLPPAPETGTSTGTGGGAVTPPATNSAPACADFRGVVARGASSKIPLRCSDADGDTLTRQIVKPPTGGKLGEIDQAAGTVAYAPNAGFSGQDSFEFKATDERGAESSRATATLTVPASEPPPAALPTDRPPPPQSPSALAIDLRAPALASDQSRNNRFVLSFAPRNPGALIDRFELEVRNLRGGRYQRFDASIRAPLYAFGARYGSSLRFRARAVDSRGVRGPWSYATTIVPLDDRFRSRGAPRYVGRWFRPRDGDAFAGFLTRSRRPGDRMRWSFRGDRLFIVGVRSPSGGRALVTLDGRRRVVSFFGRRTAGRQVIAALTPRGRGLHRLEVVNLGGSRGDRIDVDALGVLNRR